MTPPEDASQPDKNDLLIREFRNQFDEIKDLLREIAVANQRASGSPFVPPVSSSSVAGSTPPPRSSSSPVSAPSPDADPGSDAPVADSGSSASGTRARLSRMGDMANRAADWMIKNLGEPGTPDTPRAGEGRAFTPPSTPSESRSSGSSSGGSGSSGSGIAAPPGDPVWATALRPRWDQPMSIPRYGEFNVQDVLGLGAQTFAKITMDGEGNPRTGAKVGGFEIPGSAFAAAGRAGALLDTGSDVAPYFAAAKQILNNKYDLQVTPRAMQAENLSMGFKRGGVNVGIGGFGFNWKGIGPIPFGDAGQEQLRENIDAIKMGAHAGISTKEFREIQRSLKQQGYTGNDLSRMSKVLGDIRRNKDIGDIGSTETTAPLVDQMMRYGTTSVNQLSDTLKGLGEVALKTRMPVDELKNSLNEFANDQQQKGATYQQGVRLGKEYANATGMDPRLLGQFQNNSIVQGMFMSKTGLLPQMMGISPLGTQMESIYKSMDLLGGAFGHLGTKSIKTPYGEMQVSAEQQRDALVAQQMGTTPDVIAKMRRERKEVTAAGYLGQFADQYGDAAERIHDSKAPQSKKSQALADLYKGRGGMPGMAQMKKAMKDAGFSDKEIQAVDHTAPWQRGEKINEILSSKSKDRTDPNSQTIHIEASPELRRWFKMYAPEDKALANDGRIAVNTSYGTANPRVVAAARASLAR